MKIKILGCNGGIGGTHMRTTSVLIDQDILIDAGTGITDLEINELAAINHVFITHPHLDHIAALPMMLDAIADRRTKPLLVHATQEIIEILKKHIFNWLIWPDFSKIPSSDKPSLCFSPINIGTAVALGGNRQITPLPVDHTVPAVGYKIDSESASLVFSGDTGSCDQFWQEIKKIPDLRYLIIECAFPNSEISIAKLSKHYCPQTLLADLKENEISAEIFIMHLKPGMEQTIMEEIAAERMLNPPQILSRNTLIEL